MSVVFDGLTPASDTEHARWFVEDMRGKRGVALKVPGGFEAYVRLLHPLGDGSRWVDVAAPYVQRGLTDLPVPFPDSIEGHEGDMGAELTDALVPYLAAATNTADRCHFGLWDGWGDLHLSSIIVWDLRDRERARQLRAGAFAFVAECAVQDWWGGRDTLLFDGPLDRVASIGVPSLNDGSLRRRSPQWWWPEDRRWFVGNEIDFPWTYLGGPADLIDQILADPQIEAVRIEHSDRW